MVTAEEGGEVGVVEVVFHPLPEEEEEEVAVVVVVYLRLLVTAEVVAAVVLQMKPASIERPEEVVQVVVVVLGAMTLHSTDYDPNVFVVLAAQMIPPERQLVEMMTSSYLHFQQ